MKKKYDVIIVGAGPAGLSCADQLKNSSFSVLLVEKNKIVGPKLCGGGLTSLSEELDIPLSKTRSFDFQQTFIKDKKCDINFIVPLKTISRFDLGQYQLKKIINAKNIKILLNTRVRSINKRKITTDKGDFNYRYLVGADGASSIVRRYLGLDSDFCVGFCCEIPKVTDDFIWVFNPPKYKSGYIWMFPHLKTTNAGIYYNPKLINANDAKKYLIEYLKKRGYRLTESVLGGAPVNYLYKGVCFGNIFLIGDAAGLCSKIWGEGIPQAIISGKEIGKKLLNPNHKMYSLKKITKIKKRQEIIGSLFEFFPCFQNLMIMFFIKLMSGSWFQYYFGIAVTEIDSLSKKEVKSRDEGVPNFKDLNRWVRW